MKFKTAIFTLAVLLGSCLLASASTISLVPSPTSLKVGNLFTVDLTVSGNSDEILGFGFNYSLTGTNIALQSVAINPFFGSDLGILNVAVAAFTFPGDTSSSVVLATFNFLAQSAGMSVLDISSDLSDPNQGLFGLNSTLASDLTSKLSINVQPTSPVVPEPASAVMLATGLVGFAGVLRRKLSH